MQVSHDFAMRLQGLSGIQPPLLKRDVGDVVFSSIINTCGAHQKFIDVSRCWNISSINLSTGLGLCSSLSFVDLSYTKFTDISVLKNCLVLRSLNCAGLMLTNFDQFVFLTTLELLNLRSSSFPITSCEPLKGLKILRSLDLGQTPLTSIECMTGMTRLEELAIDACYYLDQSVSDICASIKTMASLRLLNVCDLEHTTQLFETLSRGDFKGKFHMETQSRSDMFFEAVVRDDKDAVYSLCQSGIDINQRCTQAMQQTLSQHWRTRCKFGKFSTSFFIMGHPKSPTALHLAILFNSQNAMKLLIDLGIDLTADVFLSDVKEVHGRLEIDEAKNSKRDTLIFQPSALVHELHFRSVHRLTEGFMQTNDAHWKIKCKQIQTALIELIKGDFHAEKVKKKNDYSDAGSVSAQPLSLDSSATPSGQEDKVSESTVEVGEFPPVTLTAERSMSNLTAKPVKARKTEETCKLAPRQLGRPDWRTHLIVSKLIGEPISIRAPGTATTTTTTRPSTGKQMFSLLGKKSFWLESKGMVISEMKRGGGGGPGRDIGCGRSSSPDNAGESALSGGGGGGRDAVRRLLIEERRSIYDLPIDPKDKWEPKDVSQKLSISDRKDEFVGLVAREKEFRTAALKPMKQRIKEEAAREAQRRDAEKEEKERVGEMEEEDV